MGAQDWVFHELFMERIALYNYLHFLEEYIPRIIEAERAKLLDPHEGVHNDEEEQAVAAALSELDEGITTRFLTGSAVIVGWGVYETRVERIAERVREAKKLRLGRRELRGDFLESSRRYFEDVLQLELHPKNADWGRLQCIASVRNALAHSNGVIDAMRPSLRDTVLKLSKVTAGVKVVDNLMVVSIEYVRDSFKLLDDLLTDLNTRAEREAHSVM